MKRELNKFWGSVNTILGAVIIFFAVKQIFMLEPLGIVIVENSYLYIILGIALAQVYITQAPSDHASKEVVWYDVVLAGISLFTCLYFAYHGQDITAGGWMFASPNALVTILSIVLCFTLLEALRRSAGIPLLLICCFFVFYPSFAHVMPGLLEGQNISLIHTFTFHALSPQSIVGLPIRVVAELLIGFMIFGVVLAETGGGKFFLDFASAALGRFRGGSAKVAVLSSSLFGSMSGSSISNVIATGTITIPAMKKTGFPSHYAGAVEACASTGGQLMPPIMGAAAFLMASFLNVPYSHIALSALIPSMLYYIGLLVQVDAYAANYNIEKLSPSEIPSMRGVLKDGWQYLSVLLILIYFLYLRLEAHAPFYAMAFLVVINMLRKRTRLTSHDFVELLQKISDLVGNLAVTIGAIGFIISALSITGVGASLSGELVALAGKNLPMMLILGAIASFILGMGMPTSACYIFLSIVLAPGLVEQGLNPLAVHLFILYWAIASNITLPVALAVIPAAKIAGSTYYKVGWAAMNFGFVKYLVPFIFVLSPALILQGDLKAILYALFTSFLGVFLAAEGMGKYLVGVGRLPVLPSAILIILGLAIAFPFSLLIHIIIFSLTAILIAFLVFQKNKTNGNLSEKTL